MPNASTGRPVIPIVFTDNLVERIDLEASRNALSRSALIRMAMISYLDQKSVPQSFPR